MTRVATAENPRPVLVIGGLDPTSGAGITADCAAVSSLGSHPLAVITAPTAQNTSAVTHCWPVTNSQLREQILTLLDEWQPAAIKVGLVPNAELLKCLVDTLSSMDPLPPLVLDPVGISSSGSVLSTATQADWMQLLALSTLCTPNHHEALHLSGKHDIDSAIAALSDRSQAILVTGTDAESSGDISHCLHWSPAFNKASRTYISTRHNGNFHGSGCALASSIATHLAYGLTLESAVETALSDVDRWIRNAFLPSDKSPQMILRHR